MKNIDKFKEEAINRIKCKMKLNAKLYEDGEYTYEELHAVQNKCMKDIDDINQYVEDYKNGKIKEEIDHF